MFMPRHCEEGSEPTRPTKTLPALPNPFRLGQLNPSPLPFVIVLFCILYGDFDLIEHLFVAMSSFADLNFR